MWMKRKVDANRKPTPCVVKGSQYPVLRSKASTLSCEGIPTPVLLREANSLWF